MDFTELPIIDWELGIKLAGNNKQLAKEIIDLFIKNIKTERANIQLLFEKNQYKELTKQIHKLHGAICYCGLPRLKNLVAKLETNLKNNIMDSLPSLLNQLDTEINLLLLQYSASS